MTTERRMTDAVTGYLRFWNTTPDEQRRTGEQTFTDDVRYVAPAGVMTGVAALADFTEQFAAHAGDYRFQARTEADVVHDRARLRWELQVGDASFAEGTDVLTVDDDGRICQVVTFLDRAPAQPDQDEGQRES